LIGRIASGLAHELNGPIGIALGFNELAKEILDSAGDGFIQPASLTKLKEYLSLVESANIRARTLARQVSSFAKLSPGSVSAFDLTDAFEEAAALASPAVKSAQIEVTRRHVRAGNAAVSGDRALCVISLVKLFLMSPEALPGGGSVIWDVLPAGQPEGAEISFIISAEPWGTAPSAAWPLTREVQSAFTLHGGTLGPSVSRRASAGRGSPAPASAVWELPGSLPAATPASQSQAGKESPGIQPGDSAARPAKARRRAAGK
jgi:hypothetical protein